MPILMVVIIAGIVVYLKFGPQLKEHKKAIIVSAIIVVVLAILVGSIRIIPPGYVGVQVLLGKVQSRILPSGIHLVIPIVNVNKMTVRTQEYTMSSMKEEGFKKGDDAIIALTKYGLSISLDLTVWFKLIGTQAGIVYETIGPDYIDKIVRPAIRTAIRDAAVNYNVTEIYSTKRTELSDGIYKGLVEAIKDKNVFIDKVLLRNIVLPQKVKSAIDDKIAAEQDAQKMEYVLQKAVKEKERKLIEAEGIANANRTIKASLSTQYLQWYYVQNLKEVLKSNGTRTVILPFDQNLTPILDLSK